MANTKRKDGLNRPSTVDASISSRVCTFGWVTSYSIFASFFKGRNSNYTDSPLDVNIQSPSSTPKRNDPILTVGPLNERIWLMRIYLEKMSVSLRHILLLRKNNLVPCFAFSPLICRTQASLKWEHYEIPLLHLVSIKTFDVLNQI
jgi:hypothetical protein